MPARTREPIDLSAALLEAWAASERINQYLLDNIDEKSWRAEPPGGAGRTVAALFAHIHNVRHMWLVMSAKGTKIAIPPKIDRHRLTPAQARAALAKSADAVSRLFESALESGGRLEGRPGGVVGLFTAAITHEGHHRGQICMLVRQLGFPLSQEAQLGMWELGKRWKEAGGEK